MLGVGDASGVLDVASSWTPVEPVWHGQVGNQPLAVQVVPVLNGHRLSHGGKSVVARVFTRREAALAALMLEKQAANMANVLLCPMPGMVKAVYVAQGQAVKAGEPLCMVEAMKMENVLRAERDCTVTVLLAKAGDSLAVDAVIMRFA